MIELLKIIEFLLGIVGLLRKGKVPTEWNVSNVGPALQRGKLCTDHNVSEAGIEC
jgi:hypothetical protein